MTEKQRAYIYRALVAAAPIVAFYGIATETELALWLALAGTLLGNGLAVANTSTGRTFTQRLVDENRQLRTTIQARQAPGRGRHRAE